MHQNLAYGNQKRKFFNQESISAAVEDDGKGIREAARMYNVLVETLHRWVTGSVSVSCRPGPNPVLSVEEELLLCNYCVDVPNMSFDLSRDDLMRMAIPLLQNWEEDKMG